MSNDNDTPRPVRRIPTTFDEAYAKAADAQGLTPMIEALRDEGIDYQIEQTGGWCMALVVPHGHLGNWAIVADGDEWFPGWFPANSWHDGEQEPVDFEETSVEEVVARVRRPLA